MFGHSFVWIFFGIFLEKHHFLNTSPTGFFGPGIVDLPPIQPFHTFPSLFPWDRCPHLGFFGFDIVWHLHLLTKVVPACGFLPEFETLGCCEMDLQKKKLGEIRMKQQTAGIVVDIFAFQFFLCHLETEGKNVKCPYETTLTPQKGKKNTCAPHWPTPIWCYRRRSLILVTVRYSVLSTMTGLQPKPFK